MNGLLHHRRRCVGFAVAVALLVCAGAAHAVSGDAAIEKARAFLARLQGRPSAEER